MQAQGAQREPAFTEVVPDEQEVMEPNDFMWVARADEKEIDFGTFYLVCPQCLLTLVVCNYSIDRNYCCW